MLLRTLFSSGIIGLQLVLGLPLVSRLDYAVKEVHDVPPGWTEAGDPDPRQLLTLKIGLRPRNVDLLKTHLEEISDPLHSRYGQHLSQQEVHELMRPDNDTFESIRVWLLDNDIDLDLANADSSPAGDWITLVIPLTSVEALLDAKYQIYQHEDGDRLVRTTSWSLPRSLHHHVTTIQPTTAFLRTKNHAASSYTMEGEVDLAALPTVANITNINQACNFRSMTPTCLQVLYNTTGYVPRLPTQNMIGFTNYLEEVWDGDDLVAYMDAFRSRPPTQLPQIIQVALNNGPLAADGQEATIEASLDLQIITGLTSPTTIVSYSTGGRPEFIPDLQTPSNTNEPYLDWISYVLAQDPAARPNVISTSYGDTEQSVPRSYAEAVCNQFAALTAQGVTLVFASGDFGVGRPGTCRTNDGQNLSRFTPIFPASCPYVTTVGGTMDYPEVIATDPKSGYTSGSGFSNYFQRPAWQNDVAQTYIAGLGDEHNGLFNRSGRAYPDVSAYGLAFTIWVNGEVTNVGGTSSSTPTFASVLSLVNDALVGSGRPTLGWLNPWLYSQGFRAFTDVISGNSTGCGGSGFRAGPGWDVASGFGTPDFIKILDILGL